MKTATIEINGTEYLATFNNRVLTSMESEGISMEELQRDKPITKILKLLSFMLDAGRRYAAINNLGVYPAITYDDLLDVTDTADYERFLDIITRCVAGDRQVDAVPGKKAEAEQSEGRNG